MTDKEHVPLQELIPYDKNLPAEVEDKDASFVTSVVLRTVWGWRRASNLSRAESEYYDSLALVAESIHRLNTSFYRLDTMEERVARDVEIEKLEHEARKTDLEYEIKKKRLAMERLDKENQVEAKQLDEQLSALQKKQTSSKNKNNDGLTRKEREADEAAKRYVAGLTKIKPKLDEADRIVDKMVTQGAITKEQADETREELQGIFTEGFIRV